MLPSNCACSFVLEPLLKLSKVRIHLPRHSSKRLTVSIGNRSLYSPPSKHFKSNRSFFWVSQRWGKVKSTNHTAPPPPETSISAPSHKLRSNKCFAGKRARLNLQPRRKTIKGEVFPENALVSWEKETTIANESSQRTTTRSSLFLEREENLLVVENHEIESTEEVDHISPSWLFVTPTTSLYLWRILYYPEKQISVSTKRTLPGHCQGLAG